MNQFTHPVGRRSATLTGYVQQTSSALPNLNVCPAVLICPGGGYAYCTDREAEPVALAFLNAGYNAFVLRYTVSTSCPGAEVFDNALAEAEESLIYLHDHAEELHIDPDKIAVLGFSAGAHLTGALGTMGRIRPAALLLGYGVYAADGVAMGVQMPNVLNHIDAQTPPSFLFATQGDRLVPASNSLDFASRLAALHTPYEIHIFSYGDHGASLGTLNVTAPRSYENPDLAHWFPMALRRPHSPQAAVRRRHAHAAAGVRPQADVRLPRRDRRGAAARGAAGHAAGGGGVHGRAVVVVFSIQRVGELVHVRLACCMCGAWCVRSVVAW